AQAIEQVRAWAEDEDEVFYLYLTDQEGLLSGLVPLKRLLLAPADAPVGTLAKRNPIAVRSDMDQEEIAYIFAEYDLWVLPVVDDVGRLVGVVTVDDIFDVIEEETTEDMYEMAAIPSEERTDRSAAGVVRLRLPWLLVCLGGTLLAGAVIEGFDDTLSKVIALSFFVPAVMAMGGNTGIQTATVTVRSLAIGQGQWGLVARELRVALGLGGILGVLAWGVASWWTGDVLLGGCVGAAMGAAVVLAAVMGAVVPLVFRRIGVDPAVASGPLITTLNDGLSLLLYFGIAVFFL
ncbi:MAG: magnesium transporter, partial [Gemmatimonadetes bacterium]|nr:magnesium transporter [Gemmatimonadota bacterium]